MWKTPFIGGFTEVSLGQRVVFVQLRQSNDARFRAETRAVRERGMRLAADYPSLLATTTRMPNARRCRMGRESAKVEFGLARDDARTLDKMKTINRRRTEDNLLTVYPNACTICSGRRVVKDD
jgi:hypothetical protein